MLKNPILARVYAISPITHKYIVCDWYFLILEYDGNTVC